MPGFGLENSVGTPERYSGYFRLNRTVDGHMFFFYFQARKDPENAPLLLWMTGGPGCSSALAVFVENGAYHLVDGKAVESPTGWDVTHNVIYVDQPLGTGFSWTSSDEDYCSGEECVADDMLDFFRALYEARPELVGKDLYVTGESYGGHYVPAVADRLFRASLRGEIVPPVPLRGLAIGNGLTKPSVQFGAYADYLYDNGNISAPLRDVIDLVSPICSFGLEVCELTRFTPECVLAVQLCQQIVFAPLQVATLGMNVYDIRKPCVGQLCYDFSALDEYLNDPAVQSKLGVTPYIEWKSCNMAVYADMLPDWGRDLSLVLPDLLQAGINVLIYAGDKDFICNWLGNRRWVDGLPWIGADDWAAEGEHAWSVDGEPAGEATNVGPLTFLKVFDAGHMVPMDQPDRALDMITRFTRGDSFYDDAKETKRAELDAGTTSAAGGLFQLAQRAVYGATTLFRRSEGTDDASASREPATHHARVGGEGGCHRARDRAVSLAAASGPRHASSARPQTLKRGTAARHAELSMPEFYERVVSIEVALAKAVDAGSVDAKVQTAVRTALRKAGLEPLGSSDRVHDA